MLSIKCPHCKKPLRIAPELRGLSVYCRFCGEPLTISPAKEPGRFFEDARDLDDVLAVAQGKATATA